MGWLDKLIGKAEPEAAPAPVAIAPATEPRDGIHHEIFIDDEAINGRYRWLCRVYSVDGTPYEMTGSEESPAESVQSAIRWADEKKAELRRTA